MTRQIQIADRVVGINRPAFIIAEAGVNHNGDLATAKKLILAAKQAGADCVKFQTFKAEQVVTTHAPKASYQLNTTDPRESQLAMLKKLELKADDYQELISLCKEQELVFLSTPYHTDDVDFLETLDVPAFKIASGQAVEPHFLETVAKKGKPIILSTGMCTSSEVDEAVRVIRSTGNSQIVVMQCTTNYPSAAHDCNLRAMVTMQHALDVSVGYSDHTQSLTAAIVAISLGACVIERHFTLDKRLPGPDHSSSSEPHEFETLVSQVREAESILGSAIKDPAAVEKKNAIGMRRSLVAKKNMSAGTVFSWNNLTLKRPGTGISGKFSDLVIGKKARREIHENTVISLDMIE